jgi:O-antigen/teichoic acid export membrane protein
MLFSITRLKEVIASGIWRSIQSAGEMLLSGFDLLICNIFINPTAMGVLALSKVLPMLVQGLNWQMAASFGPKLTIDYAKADRETLWRDLRRAFKITSVIGTIPLAGIIVFGREFFELWVPSQDANVLQVLSILACFWMALVAGIQPAGNAFVATNKVKPQALSVIISGVVNIVAVLIVLQLTDHGIYAIAATSVAIGLARNLLYTIPAAARYLGFKWSKFYIGVLYSMTCTAIVLALGNIVKLAINPGNWLMLIIAVAITVVLSLVISGVVVFSKSELRSLLASTSNMVTKWKGRQ